MSSRVGKSLLAIATVLAIWILPANAANASLVTGDSEHFHLDAVRTGGEWHVIYWFSPAAYGFSTTTMTGEIATGLTSRFDGLRSISGTGSSAPGTYNVTWHYHDVRSGNDETGTVALTIHA